MKNFVANEVGTLRKILIHSPDGGIGKIIPSKFKDWLYDDTVHLKKMQKEYNEYTMLLLYFLDPKKAQYINHFLENHEGKRKGDVYKPDKPAYYNSDKVIDVQKALSDVLENETVKIKLVSAICAIENCNQMVHEKLEKLNAIQLSKTLITGVIKEGKKEDFIFPPVPNLVFTRDICIVIKDHVLLSKSATQARKRESLIVKYISLYHPHLFAHSKEKIIEICESPDFFLKEIEEQKEKVISIEGGDVMMIAEHHLIVGCSERTSKSAIDAIIHKIFSIPSLEIERISVVQIPAVRAQMHIDTIFTQVKRNAWVMYSGYSKERKPKKNYTDILNNKSPNDKSHDLRVLQFYKQKFQPYDRSADYFLKELNGLEELLTQVSIEDFGVKKSAVKIIYSGNNEFPYTEREQWTDSCNVLALKEGIVIGYDRNEKTVEAFKSLGFNVVNAKDLLKSIRLGEVKIEDISDTLILLSSSELSRARGGSHCMSMPLFRERL